MSDSDYTFAQARKDNDERLLDQLSSLRRGEDMTILEPFARAYLGMFYEIDRNIDAAEKVAILANQQVTEAVLDGFVAALQRDDIPGPYEIGDLLGDSETVTSGYVVLAGMDRLMQTEPDKLDDVPDEIAQSAICFHYANSTSHKDDWFASLLNKSEISIPALTQFWQGLIDHDAHMLPGLRHIIAEPEYSELSRQLILPVLTNWNNCKHKTFIELIFAALRYVDHETLLETARKLVNDPDAIKDENKRLYWLAVAFLLSPEEFAQHLANYIGRVKQKVLPLLDFMMKVEALESDSKIDFSPMMDAQLLRIIAPIFPPQEHSYGHMGGIDVNSRNVMRLFHKLATDPHPEAPEAIKWLRKVRVMKIYNNVIKHAEQLQKKIRSDDSYQVPDFASYLAELEQDDKLIQRRNRFDIK